MAETVDFSKKANEIEPKEEKLGSMELKSGFECTQQDDPQDENWVSKVLGTDEHLDSQAVTKKETTEVMVRVQQNNTDQSEDEKNDTVDLKEDLEEEKNDNTEDGLPEAGAVWKLARLSPRMIISTCSMSSDSSCDLQTPGTRSLNKGEEMVESNHYYCRDCLKWSIIKDEEICTYCLTPVYTTQQVRPSSSLFLVNEGISSKVFQPSDLPFGLKKLNRNPLGILEKKKQMLQGQDNQEGYPQVKPTRFSRPPDNNQPFPVGLNQFNVQPPSCQDFSVPPPRLELSPTPIRSENLSSPNSSGSMNSAKPNSSRFSFDLSGLLTNLFYPAEKDNTETPVTRKGSSKSKAVAPNKPNEFEGSRKSSEFVGPRKSNESVGPRKSSESVGPRKSSQSVGLRKSSQSVGPRKSSESVGPRTSSESVGPRTSSESVGPRTSSESVGPRTSSKSVGPRTSSKSVGPRKSSDSVGPRKSSESVGPRKSSESVGPRKSSKSVGPSKSSEGKACIKKTVSKSILKNPGNKKRIYPENYLEAEPTMTGSSTSWKKKRMSCEIKSSQELDLSNISLRSSRSNPDLLHRNSTEENSLEGAQEVSEYQQHSSLSSLPGRELIFLAESGDGRTNNSSDRLESWIQIKTLIFEQVLNLKMKLTALRYVHKDRTAEENTSVKRSIFVQLKKLEDELSLLNGFKSDITAAIFSSMEKEKTMKSKSGRSRSVYSSYQERIQDWPSLPPSRALTEFEQITVTEQVFDGIEVHPPKEKERRSLDSISSLPVNIENMPPVVIALVQGPCMEFKTLFNLSDNLLDFCHGPNASKFVIQRLRTGSQAERECAYVKLRLPKQLLDIIKESEGGRNVLCTLMEVDTLQRVELLRHIKNQLRVLIHTPEFRSFLTNFLTNFKPAQKQDRHLSVVKAVNAVNTEGRVLDTDTQIVDRFLEELISREKN